jgi:hypothetical protein
MKESTLYQWLSQGLLVSSPGDQNSTYATLGNSLINLVDRWAIQALASIAAQVKFGFFVFETHIL